MNAADGSILLPWARLAADALALALLYLCAFRPLLRWLAPLAAGRRRLPSGPGGGAPPGPPRPLAGPGESLPSAEAAAGRRVLEEARRAYEEVCASVAADPGRAADLLRAWMKERA